MQTHVLELNSGTMLSLSPPVKQGFVASDLYLCSGSEGQTQNSVENPNIVSGKKAILSYCKTTLKPKRLVAMQIDLKRWYP